MDLVCSVFRVYRKESFYNFLGSVISSVINDFSIVSRIIMSIVNYSSICF